MLEGPPDHTEQDAALAAFGLRLDRPPTDDPLLILPHDLQACVSLFTAVSTQWNVGMGGPICLRYEALPFALQAHGIPRAHWRAVWDDIRSMEAAALEWFDQQREQRQRRGPH